MPIDFTAIFAALGGFWAATKGPLATLILAAATSFSGCLSTGCTFHLYGSGEAGIGHSSTSKLFAYHKAEEGNKATAKSSSELSEPIVNAIFEKKEPAEKPAPNP